MSCILSNVLNSLQLFFSFPSHAHVLCVPFNIHLCSSCPFHLAPRLQFEARNQKKEAKEMAVIEAMKRKEQQDQSEAAAQEAH